ncbi:RNA 3'-terminal phosphate cyclase [Natrialbaceae archaeon GCM10025810]|uniref:RNA 3'-terminal phosphate cyclase n=1 Tax=Halovalidus salilacus TaxID=3075124 RepID=UPI00360618AD
MHTLDGSSAGGQYLRTALALSVLEGEPIRVENVRGDRSTPGLRPQHLAALETMAAVADADVSGAAVGAETIEFDPTADATASDPGAIPGGSYAVDIGTAGSVTLLFEALLPLATALESPLSVTATGGTDVAWSPPMDYFRRVKLPLVRRFGLVATCEVHRRGFHPEGGGRATLRLAPSTLEPVALDARGPIDGLRIYSVQSSGLAGNDVARRQVEGALERLSDGGLDRSALSSSEPTLRIERGDRRTDLELRERRETTVASPCPGTAVVIRLEGTTASEGGESVADDASNVDADDASSDGEGGSSAGGDSHPSVIAGCSALGEPGKRAERVGEEAADAALRFLEGDASVDRHAADQFLVLLALAGGRVRIPAVTEHVEAGLALLESMDAGLECSLEGGANGTTLVADGR